MTRGEIRLHNESLAVLDAYLIKRGIPLPPGAVTEPDGASITDAQGTVLPSAGKVLQRRPDGSIEWLLMDILVALGGQEDTHIYIEPKAAAQPAVAHPVTLTDDGTRVTLANGLSSVVISREGGSLFRRLIINGREVVREGMLVDLQVVDGGGKIHRASLQGGYSIEITHQNRLRTEVTITGKHQARDGATFLDFALRVSLAANSPDVTLDHTFYCREPREGKIPVRAMRLVMPTALDGGATKLLRQTLHGYDNFPRDMEIAENIEVVAANTGDIDNYASTYDGANAAHPGAGGSIFLRNFDSLQEDLSAIPFHMRPGQRSGFRAFNSVYFLRQVNPIVGWKDKDFTLVTSFEHFRQLHPKSIHIDESQLTFNIWPEWSIPMQLVMGASKSHQIWITGEAKALTMDDVLDVLGRWEEGYVEPVDISFDPAWPAYCQALECHQLLPYEPNKYPLLENLIEPVPSAGNPARHTYDRQPAIGMFHFGDHVNADATSCSNNEDDINVYFPLQHFLRTGQTYAWDYGKEAARHYMEVDFCEWSTDPRQHGGLIAHTGNHFIGCVYPSHQWAEGILAYYYMSGDERAKKAVIGCGDNNYWWAYNMLRTLATDGREAGMPLVNMAAAYRLTGDTKYLEASKHICENFFVKYIKEYGTFKYPKQGTADRPHKLITGYGDWSSFAGLYRLWEVCGDEYFREQGITLLKQALKPEMFSLNDIRGMDFLAAWAYGVMIEDMEQVITLCGRAIPMLLRRGGHPLRRLHFLKELHDRGLIDDSQVGNRAGVI